MRHGSSRNAVIRYNNTRTDRMRTESENGREKLNLVTEQLEPRITAEVYYAICVCNWLMMPTKCTLKEDEVSADQFVVPTDKPYPRQKFKFLLRMFRLEKDPFRRKFQAFAQASSSSSSSSSPRRPCVMQPAAAAAAADGVEAPG